MHNNDWGPQFDLIYNILDAIVPFGASLDRQMEDIVQSLQLQYLTFRIRVHVVDRLYL